eukprot:TRINITY_DN135_c1_g1_i4.p1 TRINITY_DN135_c1_g1~~TRINITY_DN135_c1_g1_i4.p1  ORF type:complete len:1665 (+),score=885.28 TRINITY_DN135_c1_g1_i4:124-5118(+)
MSLLKFENNAPVARKRIFRFSDEQYTSMSGYFTKFEQDGDGELNFAELENLVREVAKISEEEQLKAATRKLMDQLDVQKNDSLTFNEFLKGYERMLASESAEDLDILKVTAPKGPAPSFKAAPKAAEPPPKPAPEPAKQEPNENLEDLLAKIKKLTSERDHEAKQKGELSHRVTDLEKQLAALRDSLDSSAKNRENELAESLAKLSAENERKEQKLKDLQSKLEEKDRELSSKPTVSQAGTISYTFRWPYGGQKLAVGGQWNDWHHEPMKLEPNGEFSLRVDGLKPQTRYLYKYHVDGVWKEDLTAPTDDGELVNGRNVINNILVTGSAAAEERLTETEKERDSLFRKVKRLEQKLKEDEDQSNANKSERDNLSKQLEKALKDLEDAKKIADKLEKDAKEKENLSKQLEKALKDLEDAKRNADSSERDAKDKDDLSKQLEKALKDLEELRKLHAKCPLESDFKNLEDKLKKLEEDLEKERKEAKKREEEFKELEKSLSQSDSDATKNLKDLQNQLEVAKKSLKEEEEKGKEREEKFKAEKKENEEKLKKEREENEDLKKKLADLMKQLRENDNSSAEDKAKREAEEKARREAEEKAKKEAEEKAKREAEEKAKRKAEKAKKLAEEEAKRQADEKARKEAEEKAKKEAEEKAKREAEEKAKRKAEKAQREAEEKAKREAEDKSKKDLDEKARREAEEKAKKEAEEKAKKKADKAKKEAEEKAKKEAEEKAKREAEEKAKKEAEEKAKREADEKAKKKAQKEAEEKAKREAEEERLRKEAEEKAKNPNQEEDENWNRIIAEALQSLTSSPSFANFNESAKKDQLSLPPFQPVDNHPFKSKILSSKLPATVNNSPDFLHFGLNSNMRRGNEENNEENNAEKSSNNGNNNAVASPSPVTPSKLLKPSKLAAPSPKKVASPSSSSLSIKDNGKESSPSKIAKSPSFNSKAKEEKNAKESAEKFTEISTVGEQKSVGEDGLSEGARQILDLMREKSPSNGDNYNSGSVWGGPKSGKSRALLEASCATFSLHFSAREGEGASKDLINAANELKEFGEGEKATEKSKDAKANKYLKALLLSRLLVLDSLLSGENAGDFSPFHWLLAQNRTEEMLGSDVFNDLFDKLKGAKDRILNDHTKRLLQKISESTGKDLLVSLDSAEELDEKCEGLTDKLVDEYQPHKQLFVMVARGDPKRLQESKGSNGNNVYNLGTFEDSEGVLEFLDSLFDLKDEGLRREMGRKLKGRPSHPSEFAEAVASAGSEQVPKGNPSDLLREKWREFDKNFGAPADIPEEGDNNNVEENAVTEPLEAGRHNWAEIIEDPNLLERAQVLLQSHYCFGPSCSIEDPSFLDLLPFGFLTLVNEPGSERVAVRLSDDLEAQALTSFLEQNGVEVEVNVGQRNFPVPQDEEEKSGMFNEDFLLRAIRNYFGNGNLDEHPYFVQNFKENLPEWAKGSTFDYGESDANGEEEEQKPLEILHSKPNRGLDRYLEKPKAKSIFVPEEASGLNAFWALNGPDGKKRAVLSKFKYGNQPHKNAEAEHAVWQTTPESLYSSKGNRKNVPHRYLQRRNKAQNALRQGFESDKGAVRIVFLNGEANSLSPFVNKKGDVVVVLSEKHTPKLFDAPTWKWLKSSRVPRTKKEIEEGGRSRRFKRVEPVVTFLPSFHSLFFTDSLL